VSGAAKLVGAKRVHLPSGRVVSLSLQAQAGVGPRRRAAKAPLFSELVELVRSGELVMRADGDGAAGASSASVDIGSLPLRDFHALRAVATRLGWLHEEPIDFDCRNCEEPMHVAPCASLQLGPFVDGELDDPELDRTLDLTVAHAVPPIRLGGGRVATEARLDDVTVDRAAPLHRALRRRRLAVTDRLVTAMGVAALGDAKAPAVLAEALARCSDAAWGAIGGLFLAAHYPLRLGAAAVCPKCGARNDVDAPYEREFDATRHPRDIAGESAPSNAQVFPSFDAFDERARAIFERAGDAARDVALVVEGGVPACDDGGEPLLGSYVPPIQGDATQPTRGAEVTVYYRTFRAMWDEDGPYDWDGELDETIEHELEHHEGWLVGDDPMDEEERDTIAREQLALVGRKATVRAAAGAFGGDVRGFLARTWPIWLIVAAATFAVTVCGK
jgi:hypothetical protein